MELEKARRLWNEWVERLEKQAAADRENRDAVMSLLIDMEIPVRAGDPR